MSAIPYVRALAAQLVLGPLSWRHYARLPTLPPELDERPVWPRVSIVVPARDEAARLPTLLRSLQDLDYPDYAVIVVDDESTDDTAAIAARAGARVVRGTPLPPGWTGKSHACRQGAEAADGVLLLFTDADTAHERASLRAAVAYLEREGLGALSLITGQRCETFFERLLLPVAYAVLFAGVSPRRVNRPAGAPGASPLANGQYILCRRADYERAGGHAAVRGSLIEDAALARALARAGIGYRLCRAESLVSVRMYEGLRELWVGFRKNAARYVLDDPRRLPGTALYSTALASALPLLIRATLALTAREQELFLPPSAPSGGTWGEASPQTPAKHNRWRLTGMDLERLAKGQPGAGPLVVHPASSYRAISPRGWAEAPQLTRENQRTAAKSAILKVAVICRMDHLGSGPCHGPSGPGRSRSGRRHARPGPRRWHALLLALADYLLGVAGLVPWYRRFGVPARYVLLYPLAVAIFGLVTADSLWRALARQGSSWKGRTYQ